MDSGGALWKVKLRNKSDEFRLAVENDRHDVMPVDLPSEHQQIISVDLFEAVEEVCRGIVEIAGSQTFHSALIDGDEFCPASLAALQHCSLIGTTRHL